MLCLVPSTEKMLCCFYLLTACETYQHYQTATFFPEKIQWGAMYWPWFFSKLSMCWVWVFSPWSVSLCFWQACSMLLSPGRPWRQGTHGAWLQLCPALQTHSPLLSRSESSVLCPAAHMVPPWEPFIFWTGAGWKVPSGNTLTLQLRQNGEAWSRLLETRIEMKIFISLKMKKQYDFFPTIYFKIIY